MPSFATLLAGPPSVVLVLSMALAVALAAQTAAAATITVTAERRADAIDVEASALLKADPITAWRVLTDYERYVEFIPGLRVSRVVGRQGATVTVVQSGDTRLWALSLPLEVTYEVTEFPPTRLQSRAVAGSLRSLESSYQLTPANAGVRLRYAGRIAPGFELLGPVETLAVKQSIALRFQALADQIELRSTAAGGVSESGPRPAL